MTLASILFIPVVMLVASIWLYWVAVRIVRQTHNDKLHAVSHMCARCSYDLRGLKDDTTCPECGADAATRVELARARIAKLPGTLFWLAVAACIVLVPLFHSVVVLGTNEDPFGHAALMLAFPFIAMISFLLLLPTIISAAEVAQHKGVRKYLWLATGSVCVVLTSIVGVALNALQTRNNSGVDAGRMYAMWVLLSPVVAGGALLLLAIIERRRRSPSTTQ